MRATNAARIDVLKGELRTIRRQLTVYRNKLNGTLPSEFQRGELAAMERLRMNLEKRIDQLER